MTICSSADFLSFFLNTKSPSARLKAKLPFSVKYARIMYGGQKLYKKYQKTTTRINGEFEVASYVVTLLSIAKKDLKRKDTVNSVEFHPSSSCYNPLCFILIAWFMVKRQLMNSSFHTNYSSGISHVGLVWYNARKV